MTEIPWESAAAEGGAGSDALPEPTAVLHSRAIDSKDSLSPHTAELQHADFGERRVEGRVQAQNFRPQRCRALRAMHDTFARKALSACAQHGEPCARSPEPRTARLSILATNRESLARKVG
jgi:hypothetical protein